MHRGGGGDVVVCTRHVSLASDDLISLIDGVLFETWIDCRSFAFFILLIYSSFN